MKLKQKLINWFKSLIKSLIKKEEKIIICPDCHYYSTVRGVRCVFSGEWDPRYAECPYNEFKPKELQHLCSSGFFRIPRTTSVRVPKPGSKIGDIGRHMKKHGKQSKEYRRSVKAKVKVEDEQ